MSNITIRLAETEEDRFAVFRFRYTIYVEEMQRFQTYADHELRIICEPLDDTGHILLASNRTGEVVGTGRNNFSSGTLEISSYSELYSMPCVGCDMHPAYTSITTKFMVAPAYRCGTLSVRLAKALYGIALLHGIHYDFIDCNPHLEKYFKGLGYKIYTGRIQHPEYGDVMPMILDLHDITHLRSVGSPFVADYMSLQSTGGTDNLASAWTEPQHSDSINNTERSLIHD